MKVLLFGGSGYIGTEFIRQFQMVRGAEVILAPARKPNGDSFSYRELSRLIVDTNPDVVINCAAYVGGLSIANCENRKDMTIKANVIFPQMLGEICNGADIVFCHMSSGCIYNGYVDGGYIEDDEPNLTFKTDCSFYTGTKALTEELLRDIPNKYIWRIRLPFDNEGHPRNYLKKILSFDKLINFDNSISNRKELVGACIDCIRRAVPFGTYNVTNPGYIKASEIVDIAKRILKIDKEFKYFESIEDFDKVRKIPTSNVILNTDKLCDVGIKLMPIHDSVEWAFKHWQSS